MARIPADHRVRLPLVLMVSLLMAACGWGDADTPGGTELPPRGAGDTVHEYDHLRDETERLVRFLRGDAPLDPGLLADSVTLRIAPEGGGQQRRASRQELRDRDAWHVDRRSFLPPSGLTHLTLAPGLHFNCMAQPLESRAPDLASRPHVGVRLAAADDATCLQTWNATFVFDGDAASPALVAVIYDQWEW